MAVQLRPHGRDPLRVHAVDAARAGGAVDHEPRGLEHLQVLRHRGATDGQLAGDLPDRQRALDEAFEDRPPRGVAERRPSVSVSLH
jgi:hypothetical protein